MLCLLLSAAQAIAQSPAPPASGQSGQVASDEDPTQIVVFNVREVYTNLADGGWTNQFILRSDRALLKTQRGLRPKGVLLRFDLPVAAGHVGTDTDAGLGDLYAQALFFPRLSRGFNFATGIGTVLPTATSEILGSGKWTLAPLAVPVWFFENRRGFAFVKVQDYVSIVGDRDRSDIHFLQITPTVLGRLSRRWWILADTEATIDWEHDNRASFKSGLQIGRIIGRTGIWIKPEIPWGRYRRGDWILKVSLAVRGS